jgi:hypothetical protein
MKTLIKKLLFGITTMFAIAAIAQTSGTFYLRSQGRAPFPFDPYGGMEPITVLDASNRIYLVEDNAKDHALLTEIYRMSADLASPSAGMEMNSPALDNSPSSGFRLNLAPDDDNTGYVYFDTQPGLIYNIEESTNLLDWTASQTFVADDTNFGFTVYPTEGAKFYRASVPDDRISFPDWSDYVEGFAYFNVSTTIAGTYHEEL